MCSRSPTSDLRGVRPFRDSCASTSIGGLLNCASARCRFIPATDLAAGSKFDHANRTVSADDQMSAWEEDDITRGGKADDTFVGCRCVRIGLHAGGWWISRLYSLCRSRRKTVYLLQQESVGTDLSLSANGGRNVQMTHNRLAADDFDHPDSLPSLTNRIGRSSIRDPHTVDEDVGELGIPSLEGLTCRRNQYKPMTKPVTHPPD